jgi:hypothetical protein
VLIMLVLLMQPYRKTQGSPYVSISADPIWISRERLLGIRGAWMLEAAMASRRS